MYAASFEARHDCPVGLLSRELPRLRILHWCVNNRDVFQALGPVEDVETFQSHVEEDFGLRHGSRLGDSALLITERCECAIDEGSQAGAILDAIEEAGAWDIPPIVYQEGWESWRVLAWNEASLREMFQLIRERADFRLVSLRPVDNPQVEKMLLVPASDIFAGLTDRQMDALVLGLEHGYYSLPSETKIDRLAEGVGVSPSTMSEHLRKAETRILRNLRPYLQAYAVRAGGESALARIRAYA